MADDRMDEAKLNALLMADMPPAQDTHFVMAVMQRAEQHRYRSELVKIGGLAAAAALLLALIAPSLERAFSDSLAPLLNDGVIGTVLLAFTIAGSRLFTAGGD